MNATFKALWLEALRSGDYKQGTGHLHNRAGNDGYCCLGVLFNAANPEEWLTSESHEGNPACPMYDDEGQIADSSQGMLTDQYLDRYGLTNEIQSDLILMNDGEMFESGHDEGEKCRSETDSNYVAGFEPKTFTEIADYIEANL